MTTAQPGQEQRMETCPNCNWPLLTPAAARPTADLGEDGELVEISPADDEETRAFVAGWNAARSRKYDFDMAMHWWLRDRCGI